MLISNIFICGFMCSAIKKSWKVSTTYVVNISLWILQVPRGFARDMFQTFQWKKALMRTKILMYKFSHKKMAKFQTFQWKKLLRTKITHVQVSHKKMAKLFKWHKSQHKKVYHTPTQYLPNNRVGPKKLIVKSTFLQVFYLLVMYWLIIVYVDIFRKNNKICCTFIRQVRVLTSSTYLPTYFLMG